MKFEETAVRRRLGALGKNGAAKVDLSLPLREGARYEDIAA